MKQSVNPESRDPASPPANRFRAWLLAIGGGVLTAIAFPLVIPQLSLHEIDPAGHMGWIAFFGLIPILIALDRARTWRRAFALGLLAGMAFFYVAIYWVNFAMTNFGGLPFGLAVVALSLLVLYGALHWAMAFAVSWAIRRRLGWGWWRHLPIVWVAFELLRDYLFSGFPWANLGYSQARHLVIAQIASIGGVYLLAALVVLVNCVFYEIVSARVERRPFPRGLVLATAGLAAAASLFGVVHLKGVRARMAGAPKVRIGLVQGNINQGVKNAHEKNARYILERYLPLTMDADRAGVDLVVWPEATFPIFVPPTIPSFAGLKLEILPLQRAHLLLGASTLESNPDGYRVTNSVFLLRPDLSVVNRYDKHHTVPFGEYVPLAEYFPFIKQVVPDMAPTSAGQELTVMRMPLGSGQELRLAPMICYDAIFPEINVEFAKGDPEILINPTNDAWYGYSSGPYQFLDIIRIRAIEAGKGAARPAYAGVTALVLPTGEVAPGAIDLGPVDPARAPNPDQPAQLLIGELPRLRGFTLYTRFGDLFAYASVVYAAGVWALALRRRRRPAPDRA